MENNFLALVLAMHSKMLQDPCLEAISLLIQGSLMMQLEKLPEAEKHFRAILEKVQICLARKEAQLPAFATFEIGLIYMRQGEFDKARNALSKAKSLYSDYEVENRLHAKTRAMLSYMKQHGLSGTSKPVPVQSISNGTMTPSPEVNGTPSAAKKSQDDIRAAIDEIETEANSQPAVQEEVAAD
jgi:tetratricopeptide (TPR) repeat protein